MTDVVTRLSMPFPADAVSWRPGSMTKDKTKARALAYLDARDVMERLDDVCGAGGWQCEYVPMPNGTTCCRIGILIYGHWVWRSNGAGNTDIEGEKGGYSDAFKRAAVLWGVGRYLYGIDSPWVRINEWKQIDPADLPKLRALLSGIKPKSAYQARKDGDWPALANTLRQCSTPDEISEFLEAHSNQLAAMPDGWRPKWDDLVEQVYKAARVKVAA